MDTKNWGLEVKPYGWPHSAYKQSTGYEQSTGYLRCAAPKVRSLPKQQQSNERFITFYKQGQTNVQDREVKWSILISFCVIIVVSIHPPYRMIYSPITLLKGWIPLEHESIDTECSKDRGGQDFVADWTLSLSVMVNKYIEHLPRNSKTSTSQIHTRTRKLGWKLIWDDLSVSKNGVHSPPKKIELSQPWRTILT
jgi:hypothetical protein